MSLLKVRECFCIISFFSLMKTLALREIKGSLSNYWLNSVELENKESATLLEYTNSQGVMTRPVWTLMNQLEMFKKCPKSDLENSFYLADRIVNLPSSVRI